MPHCQILCENRASVSFSLSLHVCVGQTDTPTAEERDREALLSIHCFFWKILHSAFNPTEEYEPWNESFSSYTSYTHSPRLLYLKWRASSTRQGCAIIWNFKKYWGMTHLLWEGGLQWWLQTMLYFLFEFALWSPSLPANCFWDNDLRISPERPQRAKTKPFFVIFDLEMFDTEVNGLQFVLLFKMF